MLMDRFLLAIVAIAVTPFVNSKNPVKSGIINDVFIFKNLKQGKKIILNKFII